MHYRSNVNTKKHKGITVHRSKIVLSFGLLDNPIPPKDISKLLDIKPYTEMEKGAKNPKNVVPRTNLWIYQTSALPTLEDEYIEFISIFKSKWQILKEITNEGGNVEISIIVNILDEYPSIIIPKALIQIASEFRSCIDIAFYDDINDDEVSKVKLDFIDIQKSSQLNLNSAISSGWLEDIGEAWDKLKLERLNSSTYKNKLIINVNKKLRLPSGYITIEIVNELANLNLDIEVKYVDLYE
ncbi:DUF4279 domain-containing protein [Bartonella sp. HY761]|uniref:DUF4279 domain-containing protein n=1 Tax=Bartonella sp. HY761 TaxID=2979330 RepID=UPI0021FDCA7F|nr:DUF4279 domain-containing protein [Bartonella sp. HY761]UXN05143.1 DUF4279 domain-containing protein [Bartonella sp. HY761]